MVFHTFFSLNKNSNKKTPADRKQNVINKIKHNNEPENYQLILMKKKTKQFNKINTKKLHSKLC